MEEPKKTKAELLDELKKLRAKVAQMEKSMPRRDKAQKSRHKSVATGLGVGKLAERTLRDTNELLERIFSTPQVLLAYMDRDFNFIRVNRAYAEADERTTEFYIGKNHFDLFPNEDNETIFRRVVETGEPYTTYAKAFEYAEHPERGVSFWDWTLLPVKDAAGAVHGVLLLLVDVTARARAEQELTKQRQRLEEMVSHRTAELDRQKEFSELLVRSSVDGILAFDRQCRYTLWNSGMERISGVSASQTIGKRAFDVFPVLKELGEDKCMYDTLDGKSVVVKDKEFNVPETRKKGFFESVYSPLYDKEGTVIGGLAIVRETTERKLAQDAMRRALEESHRRATDTSALLESTHAVLEHQNFSEAAEAIFKAGKNLIGATSGYISLLSRDGTQNEAVFIDSGPSGCTVDPNLPMPIRGMRAEAYKSGKPVYENNFAECRWKDLLPPGHAPLDNALFAPLLIGDNAIGLIGLGNKPGGFTEEDARLAAAFAAHAAIAFRNSRYLTAISKSEERYRLLSESLEETVRKKVSALEHAQRLATLGQ
ncbi:MAG: PAS domain-containing protein, partial [Candidatus Lindowbacteria bacterium]|nr:PAS domain-containing protein [Candidatus Lindowbacteria bacterium]